MPKSKELKFEDGLQRLEAIVEQLENKEVALEESLGLFEEGIGLARVCQAKLEDAKKRVEVLVKETGELKPFKDEESL